MSDFSAAPGQESDAFFALLLGKQPPVPGRGRETFPETGILLVFKKQG